jgi:hypothetical protein
MSTINLKQINKTSIVIGVLLLIIFSCKENNQKESLISEQSTSKTDNEIVVNVESENACVSFLKGKTFKSNEVSLVFLIDGYAEVRNTNTNSILLNGTFKIGSLYGQASRKLEIIDIAGSGTVKLVLGTDGKLMDESDFTIYKL